MAMKLLRKRPAIEDSKYRADRDPVNVWNGEKLFSHCGKFHQ